LATWPIAAIWRSPKVNLMVKSEYFSNEGGPSLVES
jgi:hypothetical protein